MRAKFVVGCGQPVSTTKQVVTTRQSASERLGFYTRHKIAKYIYIWASSMHTLISIGLCWCGHLFWTLCYVSYTSRFLFDGENSRILVGSLLARRFWSGKLEHILNIESGSCLRARDLWHDVGLRVHARHYLRVQMSDSSAWACSLLQAYEPCKAVVTSNVWYKCLIRQNLSG